MARRKHKKHGRRRFRKNPIARRRRFRRNPIGGAGGGFLGGTIMPGLIGAGGAIAVDMALGNLPIPASMKTGPMLPLVRIGSALLLGMAVGAVAGEQAGDEAAAGGVIVTLYSVIRNYLQQHMPNVQLARYVPMNRVRQRMGFVRRPRLAAMPRVARKFRLRGNPNGGPRMMRRRRDLGYIGPAPTFNPRLGRYVLNARR